MIDTKALRSRILDLAIQGKLTEQLESDGTAEELYQQIQAEKQALIKEGKIKKEKPLPEISADEIPFEIPSNWKWVCLQDIAYLTSGSQYEEIDEGIPYIKVADMNLDSNLYEIRTSTRFVSESNNGIIPISSIIFPKRGGAILTNKKRIVSITPVFIDSNTMAMTLFVSDMLLFIKHWFDSIDLGELHTGTSIPQINNKDLYPLIIPLPPLAEQKRIVERVEEIFRLLDTIDKAQEKYAADSQILKAKLITAGIQGKLTKQLESDGTAHELYQQIQEEKQKLIKEGKLKKEKPLPPISPDEIPFEIPQNWMWVRLGDVFTLQAGKFISASQISDIQDSENQYKCFGGNGVRGYVNDYNTTGTHALIGRQGALCGNVNLAHDIFYATEHAVVVYQYCDTDVNWIFYGLTELNLNQYATSVAQPGLAVGKIEKVLIPLPPLAEQKRIADVLERVLGEIE